MMLLAALALAAAPTPAPRLTVKFVTPPEVHFNRRGDSTLTVMVGKTSRTVTLDGVLDPADPKNVYLSLNPATLDFARQFRGPVRLRAHLYLCDAKNGICTVKKLEKMVQLRESRDFRLDWKVEGASR
ncbi:hypothetical protein DESA109040_08655 [Deinococcus saxicola]|uniref:hypothetical protein n=1 Tax=Deinococcus saxicola TaxID=249406 RepID=UPI0039F10705